MDSTRAPVPSDHKRLGGHNRIAPQRPPRLAALQALAFCIVVTTLIVVPPAQLSPANLLEGQLPRPPDTEAQAVPAPATKPDVWAGGFPEAGHKQSGVGRPGTAFSRYVKTTNHAKLSRLRCAEGRRLRGSTDSDGSIVVLDFGRPTQKGKGRGHQWGASLFRRGFHPISAIQQAAQAYAQGVWRCMDGANASTHLTIAIGTSNFGRAVSFWHGRAWAVEDVWYVAWGSRSARPLPEIYNPNGIMAEQWYRLSLYSVRKHGVQMWIAGVMSQRTAFRQSKDPCHGMNNTPAKAWRLLHRALNRDKRTAQNLHWSTDIAWAE